MLLQDPDLPRAEQDETANVLPGWMRPPRAEGWLAEDLDLLPDAPRHTELVHGSLVFALDEPTGTYRPVDVVRGTLHRTAPFEIAIDLTGSLTR